MKYSFQPILLAAILLFTNHNARAFPPPQTKVAINSATVFLNGAELQSTVRLSLAAGESDMLLTNIAGNVNQQSLIISADNNVVIQAATFQNNYLADSARSPLARNLEDSISILEQSIGKVNDRMTVLNEQLSIIRQNKQVFGANTGLTVSELQKMLDLVDVRMNALLTEQRKLTASTLGIRNRQTILRQQLAEEQRKGYQPGGQLLVKFFTKQATNTKVTLSYVVPNAGWRPAYDLRVEKVNSPVKLFFKADVFQNSGVPWDKVAVTLSTGNPNEGVDAPELNPYFLTFYTPVSTEYNSRTNSVSLNRSYKFMQIPSGRAESENYNVDGDLASGSGDFKKDESLEQHTAVNNGGVSTTYEIDLPYTLPSDGKNHAIAVKEFELPATYRHFTVPKLDKDAFLQAQITNWEELNLIPATTNVFFEGSYVGQGFIDMRNVKDTMTLSLGRDKKIVVRREKNKDFQSERTIGSNERKSYAWTISVRNTRKETINLVVLDQLPISKNDDIILENVKTGTAEVDATTGSLRWNLALKPAELKELDFSFTVKYPKGKTVQGM